MCGGRKNILLQSCDEYDSWDNRKKLEQKNAIILNSAWRCWCEKLLQSIVLSMESKSKEVKIRNKFENRFHALFSTWHDESRKSFHWKLQNNVHMMNKFIFKYFHKLHVCERWDFYMAYHSQTTDYKIFDPGLDIYNFHWTIVVEN